MKLYVVHTTIGGYAHEDAPLGVIVGVYTDPEVARKVGVVTHGDWVTEIELDQVKPGIAELITQFFKNR